MLFPVFLVNRISDYRWNLPIRRFFSYGRHERKPERIALLMI